MSDYRELIKEVELYAAQLQKFVHVPPVGATIMLLSLTGALRSVLDEQDAAKEKAWDEGFDAAEKDIMDHDANRWENECVPNPYRRALTGGER